MNRWQLASGGRPLSRHRLDTWLRSPRGQRLLRLEQEELGRLLPEVFGRHVLQVGSWGYDGQLLSACQTIHQAVLGTVPDTSAQALTELERLPILSNSVDAVVLPHTLEFSRFPHHLLREVDRILTDRGHLFILGFNPFGILRLRERLWLPYAAFPSGAQLYRVSRLCDWLELLDCEVTEVRRFGASFPWRGTRADGDRLSIDALRCVFAEGYLMAARKRVLPMNFVGRVERAKIRPMIGAAVPSTRNSIRSIRPRT